MLSVLQLFSTENFEPNYKIAKGILQRIQTNGGKYFIALRFLQKKEIWIYQKNIYSTCIDQERFSLLRMAGVMLFLCIPTGNHEESLKFKLKKNAKIDDENLIKRNKLKKSKNQNELAPLIKVNEVFNCDYNSTAANFNDLFVRNNGETKPTIEMVRNLIKLIN